MTRSLANLAIFLFAFLLVLQLSVQAELIDSRTAAAPFRYLQNARQFIVRKVLP